MTRQLSAMLLRRAMTIALVLLASGAAFACNSLRDLDECSTNRDCERGTRCEVARGYCESGRPIRIGAVLPLSGTLRFSAVGVAAKEGLDLALAYLNAGDPLVLGRGIELVIEDDQSDIATARAKVESLIDEGVVAVIGPLTSSQVLEAQAPTARVEMLHVAPLAGARDLAEVGQALDQRFLFQLTTTIGDGSPLGLVKYLRDQQARSPAFPKCKNTVVIHNDDAAGVDYATTFRERFQSNGMCVRRSVPVPLARKNDYGGEVDALFAAGPDCVIVSVLPDVAGSILDEIERRGTTPAWLWAGTSLIHTQQFLDATKITDGSTPRWRADGFIGSDVDFTPNRIQYRELIAATNGARRARGQKPIAEYPSSSLNFVDALFLVALALEKAGGTADGRLLRDAFLSVAQADRGDASFSPGQIHDAIRAIRRGEKVDYSGASSDIELTTGGFAASTPIAIWRVEGGKFVEDVVEYDDRDVDEVKRGTTADGCR